MNQIDKSLVQSIGYSIPHDMGTPDIEELKERGIIGLRKTVLNRYTILDCSTPEAEEYMASIYDYKKFKFIQVKEALTKGRLSRAFALIRGIPFRAFRVDKGLAYINITNPDAKNALVVVIERVVDGISDRIKIRDLLSNQLLADEPTERMEALIERYPKLLKVILAVVERLESSDQEEPIYAHVD